jgi:antitoxin component YwqK of YwqJK toxin-antitoxin module
LGGDVVDRYNQLVYEAQGSKKELAIEKLNEALKIFNKYKKYFGEGNQNLGMELKELMAEWEKGKSWIENTKDWGKEYYEDGSLKAEWVNKDYLKCGDYIEYHRNGKIELKCKYLDGVNRDGLMHKYFEDGTLKELWSYDKGKRIFVKKYFNSGQLKTEWLYDKKGNEISKKYYDKEGHLIKK